MSSRKVQCYCSECMSINAAGGRQVNPKTRLHHEEKDRERAQQTALAASTADVNSPNGSSVPLSMNDEQPLTDDTQRHFVQGLFDPMSFNAGDDKEFNDGQDENELEDDESLPQQQDDDIHMGDDANDGFENEETRFFDNSAFPTEVVPFLLFVMLVLLYSRSWVTNEGLKTIMLFANQILLITNHQYRFPVRVHTLEKWAELSKRVYHGIESYVSCTQCHAMYPIELNRTRNKRCSWKDSVKNASRCNNELYTKTKNGMYMPTQMFHYNTIRQSILTLLQRPHFVHQLESKRKRYAGYHSDIQDAQAYNTFRLNPNDPLPFTQESPYNILLSLFIDWFQLYQNNSQDVRGIYATIQNLYPSERHLPHNSLILGIMNGPNEISFVYINQYLDLIVKELQVLQNGVVMQNCYGEDVLVKICVNHYQGDLPAIRKMLGFISHTADVGCSCCSNPFPKVKVRRLGKEVEWKDYSITNTTKWTPRTLTKHKEAAQLYLNQDNIIARNKVKAKNGVLHSAFLGLDYFNPITDCGIDIMHLLLNGITRRIVHNIWLGLESTVDDHVAVLGNQDLRQIADIYGRVIIPLNYENNLKRKICKGIGFSDLKSAQWLVFLILSPLVLLRVVTGARYKNFLMLVQIARLACNTCITDSKINLLRALCIDFVDDFKNVYPDPRYMSINFHMLLHMTDRNIVSFGSGPASWCFPMESRNKQMKSINTNGKSNLEFTLLKRHLIDAHLEDYVNTLPLDTVLGSAAYTSGINVLSCIQKADNENALQMEDQMQQEYLLSKERFDLGIFLEKRTAHQVRGYEHLPPSAVKSLKFKQDSSLPSTNFSLLLDYYNSTYMNCSYTLATALRRN